MYDIFCDGMRHCSVYVIIFCDGMRHCSVYDIIFCDGMRHCSVYDIIFCDGMRHCSVYDMEWAHRHWEKKVAPRQTGSSCRGWRGLSGPLQLWGVKHCT